MKSKTVIYNATVLTQAAGVRANSIAVQNGVVVAVGQGLEHDSEFIGFEKIDIGGKTIIPGLVDAHVHFYYLSQSLGSVSLVGAKSLDECLATIKARASTLSKHEWLLGEGYAPDRFDHKVEGDRHMLDRISGGRPTLILSKDQHSAWVNSRALLEAGITKATRDPAGGRIERDANGEPTGILRETAYKIIFQKMPGPSRKRARLLYKQALDYAYRKGVTGVHSFDSSPHVIDDLFDLVDHGLMGIRVNYYVQVTQIDEAEKRGLRYGAGDDFFRIAGIKIFSDGALGSQTALCFNKYIGSKENYGIEVTTVPQMKKSIKRAARLGHPCAIHAIGDRAVSNVLDAIESAPRLSNGARHRIEHVQMIRRKDIARLKRLNVVASMQPSHCTSDIDIVRRFWGARGRNTYIFKTLLNRGVDLAFGSDAPIEPLDPLAGIEAAVRRACPGKRDVFYPEERLSVEEALFGFTVGSAISVGLEHRRGYLLPGYDADYVILDENPLRVKPTAIGAIGVLATVIGGKVRYLDNRLNI